MTKRIIALMLALVALLSFAGCAATEEASPSDKLQLNDSYINGVGTSGDYAKPESGFVDDVVSDESLGTDTGTQTEDYMASQKLVYYCSLDIETLEFENAVKNIKELIEGHGGFIESDVMRDNSWNWYHSDYHKSSATLVEELVIRIPTENYNSFLRDIEGNGKIMNKSETVTNITKSYNDTVTNIQMYEKEEALLLEMMDRAESIDDMIVIESRLAEVQRTLALYRSALSEKDMDIAFSTICITVEEVVEYSPSVEKEGFVNRFIDAVKESAVSFTEFLGGVAIACVYAFPYLIIMAGIALIIILCIKKKIKKRKKAAAVSTENTTIEIPVSDN